MTNHEEACTAVLNLNGYKLGDRILQVGMAAQGEAQRWRHAATGQLGWSLLKWVKLIVMKNWSVEETKIRKIQLVNAFLFA